METCCRSQDRQWLQDAPSPANRRASSPPPPLLCPLTWQCSPAQLGQEVQGELLDKAVEAAAPPACCYAFSPLLRIAKCLPNPLADRLCQGLGVLLLYLQSP